MEEFLPAVPEDPVGHLIVLPEVQDLHCQYIFIVAAVEDGNAAPGRQMLYHPPEVVMGEFFGARLFEAVHHHTLGIEPAHHMLDGAVLTGGVHGLEHNHNPLPPIGIEGVLEFLHGFDVFGGFLLDFLPAVLVHSGMGGQIPEIGTVMVIIAVTVSFHTQNLLLEK